ncbi:MAG: DegT/DnrJ/EryC1/StrS aminotransferase family protein [Planctomycetota bacterium]
MLFSKPRTKFYGCGRVYRQIIQDLLTFRVHRGSAIADFESQAAKHFGMRHAIATPLARVGIYLCLKYFIKPEQYVLQSPYTLAEVINMTTSTGGIPLFSDVEPNNAHLDPDKLRFQENTGCMIVTHLHGIPAEMDRIVDFAQSNNIPLIEDAAQSAGTKYQDRFVGTIGNAGVISFGILKQLNSIYGGMVLTNDATLAEFIRDELQQFRKVPLQTLLDKLLYLTRLNVMAANPIFSWLVFPLLRYGMLNDVDWINSIVKVQSNIHLKHQIDGWYQHRMSPCQARMLGGQLENLEQADQERIQNAQRYLAGLAGIPGLLLPKITSVMRPTYAHFPIQVDDPANLLRWFNYYGQDVVAQHFDNCAELECFSPFRTDCPEASRVAKSLVLMPTYPGFGRANIDRNIGIVKRYFELGQPAFDRRDLLDLKALASLST